MRRRTVVVAVAVLLAAVPLAACLRLVLLHRAIAERWRPLEEAHRRRAELVPQLAEVVLQTGANMEVRAPTGPLPPASGEALLDEPAAFERWDFVQSETAGTMFDLCQAVVGSPGLQGDSRVKDLLGRLVASEHGVRGAERGFAEAVEAWRRARAGATGGWLAARLGLSERSLRLSGPTVWASPALLPRCPLVVDAAGGAVPPPMPAVEIVRQAPPAPPAPPYVEELGKALERHVDTWRPCAAVSAEYQRKVAQAAEAHRAGRHDEASSLERDWVFLVKGPLEQCRVTRERIFQDLRATGAPDEVIDEAWQEFVKSDRFGEPPS